MIKTLLLCSLFLVSNSVLAAGKSDQHVHNAGLGSHEHGAVKLEIAVTGKTIVVDLDGSAASLIGFEYAPTTIKEKKDFSDAESLWIKDLLTKLFVMDTNLGCTATEVTFKQEIEEVKSKDKKKQSGVHSEIEAKAIITCNQDLTGKSALVSIKKHYPRIKKLSIDLIGSETKSIVASATEEIKL